jgi:hypothetical protein
MERRHRTYGLSWTTDRVVAETFAQGSVKQSIGGTVLLETTAPTEAIVCVPHDHVDEAYEVEAEYLVDRRRLGNVAVTKRYPGALASER